MGTSGTEICDGCLWTQLKQLPPQLALKLSLVRLVNLKQNLLSLHRTCAAKRKIERGRRWKDCKVSGGNICCNEHIATKTPFDF